MDPVKLAQSFLMDIAAGTVTGDEMRSRARLLAIELEDAAWPNGPTMAFAEVASTGDGHRTLLDALLEDAEEHEKADRMIQAANARAAVETLRLLAPWVEESFEVWAWIGEDEHGSTMGLKQGLSPAGMIPMVAVQRAKVDQTYIREQLQAQVNHYGKPIRLVRLVLIEEADQLVPTTWDCPHCNFPPSHNPTDVQYHFCGNCHHYCDEVTT